MKKYDEASCVRTVSKRPGVNVDHGTIIVNKNNHQVGIRTWGKIDFLVHYCKYVLILENGNTSRTTISGENENKNTKQKKTKFSLSKMVKNAMKS